MKKIARLAALLVAGLVVVVSLAACGGAGTVNGLTATDVVSKSNAAMAAVKSVSFDGSIEVTLAGDKNKVKNPAGAFLLGAPLSMTMAGSLSQEPLAMDVTIKTPLAGMVSPGIGSIGERLVGDRMYVRLGGEWYAVPGRFGRPTAGASPSVSTEQMLGILKQAGVDPTTWVQDKKDLETGRFEGHEVYSVTEELDVNATADGLAKLLADPGVFDQLVPGAEKPTQAELEQVKAEAPKIAEALKKYLRSAKVHLLVDTQSFYLHKFSLSATIDLPKEAGDQGIDGASFSFTYHLSHFNEAVHVVRPPHAKPFGKMDSSLLGSAGAAASGMSLPSL